MISSANLLFRCTVLLTCILFSASYPLAAQAATVRLKDIVDVEGVRNNMLVGYGLVVGLNGTGDSLTNSPFTEISLVSMLERLGVMTRGERLKTKNVAAVMVTATLPPFASQGTRVDVTVSTMGDAKDLLGGTLLVTPLRAADGEVYAVAQGSVSTSGFSAKGQAESVTKGVPTSGRISNGAIVEREIAFRLPDMSSIRFALRNPDLTTATRIASVINKRMKEESAVVVDSATVRLLVPPDARNNIINLLTDIEQLSITPDQSARVVIDDQSGVIVMGDNVRISKVAIAQGNLTIKVTEKYDTSQPSPLSSGGNTTVTPKTDISVKENEGTKLATMEGGVTLQELVQGLNSLGIGPRDMMTILQAIKAAGALQASLEII